MQIDKTNIKFYKTFYKQDISYMMRYLSHQQHITEKGAALFCDGLDLSSSQLASFIVVMIA